MIKIKILREKEQFIGGAADNIPDSEFDPELLKKGKEKEMHDHGLSADQADEIAKDELTLNPEDYAKELKESYNHKQFIEWLKDVKKENAEETLLLSESKLSKYWKKRAKRRALNAEREWPNKNDRDWALAQQDKSAKMNEKIYAYFLKELEESDDLATEITDVMRSIKKKHKKIKEKQIAKKFGPGTPNKPKGSISVPMKPEYGGVKKGADANIKKLKSKNKKSVGIAPTGAFGPGE